MLLLSLECALERSPLPGRVFSLAHILPIHVESTRYPAGWSFQSTGTFLMSFPGDIIKEFQQRHGGKQVDLFATY